jgi:two-component system cell cycle response regulator
MNDETIKTTKELLLGRSAKAYKYLVLLMAASLPLGAIIYLLMFGDPQLKAHFMGFHEIAITFATLTSAFVAWIAYQNYKNSGEHYLRFVSLAFLAFVLIYAPHGILTPMADHHTTLFLVFGPVSRLMMAIYLFVGLLRFKRPPDAVAVRKESRRWWPHVLFFIACGVLVSIVGSTIEFQIIHVRIIEAVSCVVFVASLLLMLYQGIRRLLMWYHMFALLLFIQASAAFLLGRPWNHMWWLAHGISAAGFFVLGYAVVRAHQTTHSFNTIYSEVELYETLNSRTEDLKREATEKERLIQELEEALAKVRILSGLLPICSSCKNIRDDKGYWNQMETYISDHSDAEFSHGLCPSCAQTLYPEVYATLYPESVK